MSFLCFLTFGELDVTTSIKSRLSNNNNMLQNFENETKETRRQYNDQEEISSNKYEMCD